VSLLDRIRRDLSHAETVLKSVQGRNALPETVKKWERQVESLREQLRREELARLDPEGGGVSSMRRAA